jgi:c-di-GMP-binding flagellar brake protein YcgR
MQLNAAGGLFIKPSLSGGSFFTVFLFRRKRDAEDGIDPRGLEAVTKRSQIVKILREAERERSPLEIRLSGRGQIYSSVILEVGFEGSQPYVVVDSLIPKEGSALLKDAPIVTGSFLIREKGYKEARMPYEFSARFIADTVLDGLPAFRLSLPSVIRRNQRREYLRIEPPVRVTINFKSGKDNVAGLVANISGGGVGFYVRPEGLDLNPGVFMTDVSFGLCDLPTIPKGVVVYLLRPLSHEIISQGDRFRHYCGAQFADIEEQVRESIVRYVVEVERMALRNLDRRFVEAFEASETKEGI